eukprot:2547894-Karenia_brevis.AAC.1
MGSAQLASSSIPVRLLQTTWKHGSLTTTTMMKSGVAIQQHTKSGVKYKRQSWGNTTYKIHVYNLPRNSPN